MRCQAAHCMQRDMPCMAARKVAHGSAIGRNGALSLANERRLTVQSNNTTSLAKTFSSFQPTAEHDYPLLDHDHDGGRPAGAAAALVTELRRS
jgi:hypothetical protein